MFFDGKVNAKGLKPIHRNWVIDVANGSSIPERLKGSAGGARERMTQLSRTAVTPQLASTSPRKSRIWHNGLQVHTSRLSAPNTSPRLLERSDAARCAAFG